MWTASAVSGIQISQTLSRESGTSQQRRLTVRVDKFRIADTDRNECRQLTCRFPCLANADFGSGFDAALYLWRTVCQFVTTVRGGVMGTSPTGSSARNWVPSADG